MDRPVTEFYRVRVKETREGAEVYYQTKCKRCQKAWHKENYKKNAPRIRARMAKMRSEQRDYINKRAKGWRDQHKAKDPEAWALKQKEARLRFENKIGMTVTAYKWSKTDAANYVKRLRHSYARATGFYPPMKEFCEHYLFSKDFKKYYKVWKLCDYHAGAAPRFGISFIKHPPEEWKNLPIRPRFIANKIHHAHQQPSHLSQWHYPVVPKGLVATQDMGVL